VTIYYSEEALVMKRLLSLAAVLLLSVRAFAAGHAAATPADISGTWTTQTEVQGIAVNETCVIAETADGVLSGTCDTSGGKFPISGKVTDKRVTFTHPAMYQAQDMTVSFFGTLDEPTSISGSIDMQPINAGGAFAMKKVK
jgi:hypothetical protein